MPAHAECDRTLRDLEVLRHIGIHIVLAVEHRTLLDVAIRSQARQHDRFDRRLVGHGQRTRESEANRTGMRIRGSSEFELATAEHLGLERGQFSMNLKTDDRFPIFEYFFELLHELLTSLCECRSDRRFSIAALQLCCNA